MNDTTGFYYEKHTSFGYALDKLIEDPGYGIRLREWKEGLYLDLPFTVEKKPKKELQLVNKYFYPITWLPKEYELFEDTWEIVTEEYKEAYKEMKK